MTERTKTIKGLISEQVDMGTFGLVELELLELEKDTAKLNKAVDDLIEYCSHKVKLYNTDEFSRILNTIRILQNKQ